MLDELSAKLSAGWSRLTAHLSEVADVLASTPLNPGEKFFFAYLLSFVALAFLSYRLYYSKRSGGFLGFLFPKRIYLHPSARVDYGIYLINLLTSPLFLVSAGLQAWVSVKVGSVLLGFNGGEALVVGQWSAATYALFILGYTLIADLSVYLVHRFHHWSSVFWPLHALHHSAEVLTPVTLFRKHPLWNVSARAVHLTFTGLFQGLFLFVFFGNPGFELLFGLNTAYVLYNFFGANLRHSHVWLSWGKPLSYLFISPAMHQIHHDPERMNRNYGEVFAIWDWLFGTLYIPAGREEFSVGLGEEQGNPHGSLAKAYFVPVRDVARALVSKLERAVGRAAPSASGRSE